MIYRRLFACNHDEYPRNLEKAVDMLDSQKLDNFKSNMHEMEISSSSSPSSRTKSKSADDKKKSKSNLVQTKSTTFKCHCCGSPDHTLQTAQ